MVAVIVRHKVKDYDAWKPVFDEHGTVRRQHGATGHHLYRVAGSTTDQVIINTFPTIEQAHAFAGDPSLREAMDRGGVEGSPEVTFAEELEVVSYEPAAV